MEIGKKYRYRSGGKIVYEAVIVLPDGSVGVRYESDSTKRWGLSEIWPEYFHQYEEVKEPIVVEGWVNVYASNSVANGNRMFHPTREDAIRLRSMGEDYLGTVKVTGTLQPEDPHHDLTCSALRCIWGRNYVWRVSMAEVVVSDHALLRYMERVYQVPLETIKQEIIDKVKSVALGGATTAKIEGNTYLFVAKPNGVVLITTVLGEGMRVSKKKSRNRNLELAA